MSSDGGMDATIDHTNQCMKSVEVADVYSTQEPQKAFHARITFCLDIHNEVQVFLISLEQRVHLATQFLIWKIKQPPGHILA